METVKKRQPKWDKRKILIFFCIFIAMKIIVQYTLYENGFISVSADEFARGIRAARWAQNPSVDILSDIRATWLPFEKYLNGSILLIWPDVIWAPRLTVFIASCLLSIILYLLFNSLFKNSLVAALSVAFLIFQPWYAWLSGTPMLEMYYFLFFSLGVYLFISWLKKEKMVYWVIGGLCFLTATGFHVQSWVYINIFNLLTIVYFIKNLKQRNLKKVFPLIGFYFLGNSLIIIFSMIEFIVTGNIFGFLSAHTNYSKWFYGGYSVPFMEKAFYYPRLILNNVSAVVWIFFVIAIFVILHERIKGWKLFPLLFALLSLLLNSGMNIISVPATAAPGRYSLIYIIAMSPYLAYGLVRILSINMPDDLKLPGYILKLLSLIIFLAAIIWGMVNLPDFPRVVSIDAVKAGRFINSLLVQHSQGQVPNYMVELKYWDFLGVEATGKFYDHVIYDRVYDIYDRNTESIFTETSIIPYPELSSQNVKYVALKSDNLKNNAESMDRLKFLADYGEWVVYEFSP